MTAPVICITGAASGIGAATCRLMQSEGAYVIGLDVRDARLWVDDFIFVDLADPASVDNAIGQMPDRVDALCNVAGIAPSDNRAKVLKVNFFGARRLTLGLLPRMPPSSSITNVASLAGMRWRTDLSRTKAALKLPDIVTNEVLHDFCNDHGVSDTDSYALSKQMMIVWTKQMQAELAPRAIRINSISPGPVETPILGEFVAAFGEKAERDIAVTGRPGGPDEIAAVINFIAGSAAHWVNGIDIPVDGGLEAASLRTELVL